MNNKMIEEKPVDLVEQNIDELDRSPVCEESFSAPELEVSGPHFHGRSKTAKREFLQKCFPAE